MLGDYKKSYLMDENLVSSVLRKSNIRISNLINIFFTLQYHLAVSLVISLRYFHENFN